MVPVSITHVIFEPLDFMARLAALVPRPRANLTRFHCVFAPNSKHRALVTPSKRGKSAKHQINGDERSPVEQHAAMTWAQRLKRVFNIDITTCEECGGIVKVIASIEDPAVIKQILAHLEKKRNQKNSTYCREQSVRFVPKVANNCSTKNDCYGAKAALCFQTSNYWFVPKAVIYHQRCGLGRVRLHLFVRRPISLE